MEHSIICTRDFDYDKRRLEDFEMWIWRKTERISWIDKVSNADVLTRVKEDRCMINTVWQRKHNCWDMCYVMKYY